VVQEVWIYGVLALLNGDARLIDEHYWEAWPVLRGRASTKPEADRFGIDGDVLHADLVWKSKAAFFEGYTPPFVGERIPAAPSIDSTKKDPELDWSKGSNVIEVEAWPLKF